MLRFYQITDLHYYPARELNVRGKAWEKRALYDQRCVAESEAIIDAVFAKLAGDRETEIVLVTGDVVCDGELAGHISLAEKLKKLKDAGKRIFLITASHDIRRIRKVTARKRANMWLTAQQKSSCLIFIITSGLAMP